MPKFIVGVVIAVLIGLVLWAGTVKALTTFEVYQGGTGRSTFTSSELLYGNGTNALSSVATTSVSCGGTTSCTSFTAIGSSPVTITSTAAAFPFTTTTNYGALTNATGTPIWFQAGLQASSTSQIAYASTTALTASNALFTSDLYSVSSAGLDVLSNNGTPVAQFGAGGGSNTAFLGGVNIDGATRLATSLTGALSAASGVVSAGTLSVANGGTGLTSCTNNYVVTGGATFNCESTLDYDGTALTISPTTVGISSYLVLINSDTDSTSGVRANYRTAGGGDVYQLFQLDTDGTNLPWSMGGEGTDGSFRVNNSTTLGTADELVITTAGNVGFGTTSPGYKLSVFGSASFGSSVSVARRLDIGTDGAMNFWYSDNGLRTFLTANNPGITAANQGNQILFRQSSTTDNLISAGAIRSISEGTYANADSDNSSLTFLTGDSGTLTEVMRLNSLGLVGIGVSTNPMTGRMTIVATSTATTYDANQLTLRSSRSAISAATPLVGGVGFETNDSNLTQPGLVVAGIQARAAGTHTAASQLTDLVFSTTDTGGTATNTVKMTITGAGNVGIGTTSPQYLFSVASPATDTNIRQLYDSDANCLENPETTGITVTCTSDEKLKENIRDSEGSAVEYLNGFRIRDYTVKASGDTVTGVVAQEVRETHPELVKDIAPEYTEEVVLPTGEVTTVTKTGEPTAFVEIPSTWVLIKANQELAAQIQELDARVTALEQGKQTAETERNGLGTLVALGALGAGAWMMRKRD